MVGRPDIPAPSTTTGEHPDEVARDQSVATHEILVALSRAGAAPEEILDVIVERAKDLCRAQVCQLYLVEPEVIRLSRISGLFPEDFRRYMREHPIARNRDSLVGRAAVDRSIQRLDDVLADPDYRRSDLQQLAGYRSLLTAPMMLDDEVVGVLSIWRTDVDPFDDDAVETVRLFAAQAAIVLRQVELLGALEARGAELATKVAQLEALRDVGVGVSSSLDLGEVLTRIVANAVQLTGADGGSVMEYDALTDRFSVRAAYGSSEDLLERLRAVEIRRDSTLVGQAAIDGAPLEVADLAALTARDPHLEALFSDGWRSVLAVPVHRHSDLVGALVIRRRTPGLFDPGLRDLLQTFAGQSGLAIVNARLYGELDSQRRELEVASRHKSEFLASMSHELRTPLNAVIGFSEVLMDQMFGDLNQRQAEYVRDIWTSGRHLLELLNEILDLSKVEAGQMVLEPTTFSIPAALESALSMVRERAASHAIALDLTLGPGVDAVEADELRFKQVVLNLVSNAVKFTPDGGRVAVSAQRHGRDLVVAVTDTGPGVPEADRERIFESFQQGGRGAPKAEGTGLGLTLSRRIVQLFGGRLWLESEEGRGSRFTFTLPVYPAVDAEGVATDDDLAAARPTILLVEDDRASLDLMLAYLVGTPALVHTAHDGIEALDMIRRRPPAAVVLDVRLPRMDGWEVLTALKADPTTSHVPVVMASIVDDRPRGLALGASAYLTKPVGRSELLDALATAGVLSQADSPSGSQA
jgi:signal transduction histidine kinase/ActR/RegA family two-component response regulator